MNRLKFFKKGLATMRTTGAITRSSRFLSQTMIENIDFDTATIIVELGAGDGVITKHILEKMRPNTRLMVFEIQASFCEILRTIDDDRLIIIEDSAEHLKQYLKAYGFDKADAIISAIPFVVLPKKLVKNIVMTCRDNLSSTGYFMQFHYSKMLKSLYESVFSEVSVSFEARNIPPAFVFKCKA